MIDKNTLLHTDFNEERHIVISAEICDGKYEMIFAKNVESLDTEFEALIVIYELTAIIRENAIQMTDIDIKTVILDVIEKLQIKAEKSQVEISCDIAPMIVQGNETLLSMLFYNLSENAIKACYEDGKVRIYGEDDQIVIEDNGKGMTAEQLLHITEPFYRTDKSRSHAEGGAGLGLALCKQIVQTYDMQMRFESELEKGTRVYIRCEKIRQRALINFTSWQ